MQNKQINKKTPKKLQLSLFAINVIIYIENPPDSTEVTRPTQDLSKVMGYKIAYKNQQNFSTPAIVDQKKNLGSKTFTIATQTVKYLDTDLIRENKTRKKNFKL